MSEDMLRVCYEQDVGPNRPTLTCEWLERIAELEAENAQLREALEQALVRAREQADLWRNEDHGDSEHADWWDKEATRLAVALTP